MIEGDLVGLGDMNIYKLQIDINKQEKETYDKVSQLLGVSPKDNKQSFLIWIYEVEEAKDDEYFDFINKFLDLLDDKFEPLSKLGIERSDISFWQLCEYDQQCNLEFDPNHMKRLGDNGITFCISCWQKYSNITLT